MSQGDLEPMPEGFHRGGHARHELFLRVVEAEERRLQDDPDFSMSYSVLWDARERTVPYTTDEVMTIVRYVASYKGEKCSKRALLTSKDVDYGMGRVYEGLRFNTSNVEIEIFKDREQALTWLGVHDHPLFRSDKG